LLREVVPTDGAHRRRSVRARQQQAERKKYGAASEAFQVLLERFPTSPLAARAQFGLATNRMANKEEIEAEVAFDDFLRLYPRTRRFPTPSS